MENTVDKNAEALEAISREFHHLVTYTDPEHLHETAWDMFQSYLLANASDGMPDDIYTYTLIYEFFRNTCKQLEKVPHVYGSRFKITYEPVTESQS